MEKIYEHMDGHIQKYSLEDEDLTLFIMARGVESQHHAPLLRLHLTGVKSPSSIKIDLDKIISTISMHHGSIDRIQLKNSSLTIWSGYYPEPFIIECDHVSESWEAYDESDNAPAEAVAFSDSIARVVEPLSPEKALDRVRSFIFERSERIQKRMEWRKDNPEAVKCCEEQLDLLDQLRRLIREI